MNFLWNWEQHKLKSEIHQHLNTNPQACPIYNFLAWGQSNQAYHFTIRRCNRLVFIYMDRHFKLKAGPEFQRFKDFVCLHLTWWLVGMIWHLCLHFAWLGCQFNWVLMAIMGWQDPPLLLSRKIIEKMALSQESFKKFRTTFTLEMT